MEDFERKERRERDKQARAMMAQEKHQEPVPLFGEPVRVSSPRKITFPFSWRDEIIFCILPLQKSSPSDSDRSIQSKLGDFSLVKHIIGEKNESMLIGIQSGIQSPAALRQPMMQGFPVQNNRGPSSTYPYHQVRFFPQNFSSCSWLIEHYTPQPPQYNNRSVFVKPNDSKPTYNGRGGYPGQPIKHDVSPIFHVCS